MYRIARTSQARLDLIEIWLYINDLMPNLRSFVLGNYLIYRIIEGGIQIIRVLHGNRDIKTLFDENLAA